MELPDNEVAILTQSATSSSTTMENNVDTIEKSVESTEAIEAVDAADAADAAPLDVPDSPAEAGIQAETIKTPLSVDDILERLRTLVNDPEAEISSDEFSRLKQQFHHLCKPHGSTPGTDTDDAVEAPGADAATEPGSETTASESPAEKEFKELLNAAKEKKTAMRQRIEARQAANLSRKKEIIEEINAMSSDTDNVNRHYPRVKELQNEFKTIGEVAQQYATENWKAYQEAIEHFYDQWKVNKELRDYDFKKNLSEKQLLIDEAKKLQDEPDVVVAFRRLQELHDKWREIGPVAKDFREEIWGAFKDESANINKRYQAFFEERKKREQENESAKSGLCETIEAVDLSSLSTYAAWNKATRVILDAQEQWKKLGYASRKTNTQLFNRFRKRCDEFFARKAEFFHSLKDEMNRNLEAKTALCEEAEALKDSTDWKTASEKFVDLQKRWKEIGTVPKKQSDTIWTRFLAACDYFFQQKKAATSATRKTEQANLATKRGIVAELTQLNSPEASSTREEAIARINRLRQQWQETGHVPFREKDKLHDTYRETVRQLFDKYDINETRARQQSFEASVKEMAATDRNRVSHERERLMRAYETRRSELQTYENNLGFFSSKSKSGDSMIRELHNKIQRLKADIADLESKITFLDSNI